MGIFDNWKKEKKKDRGNTFQNENREEEELRMQMMALGEAGNQNSLDLLFDEEDQPLLPEDEEDREWRAAHPEEEEWKKRTFWLYNNRQHRTDSQLTESREFPVRGLGEDLLSILEGGPGDAEDVPAEELWVEEKQDPGEALTMYSQHGSNSCGFVMSGFMIRDFLNKNKDLYENDYLNRFALNGKEEEQGGKDGKIPLNDRTLAKLYGKIYGMKEEDDGVAFEQGSLGENKAVAEDKQLDSDVLWKAIEKMTKGKASLKEHGFQDESAENLKEKTKPVIEDLLGQKKLVGLHALGHYAIVTGVSDEGITCMDSKGVDKDYPDATKSIGKNGFHQDETRDTVNDAVCVSWEELTNNQISVLCLEKSEAGKGNHQMLFENQ